MQQVLSVWNALDMRKRMIVAAVSVAVFAAVLLMARIASQPTMALLYSGLEPGPAGEVMEALEARGIATDVRGSAIYVDATQRDELRMTLAAEGLPGNSTKGYELLDNLSGFGTTAQMFDAAYWRAKEGELARTIASSPEIVAARVHIAVPRAQAFRDRGTPSGSVTVTTTGGALPPAQARALKFLIASAVPGLAVENVSVIDSRSGLVMPGTEDPGNRPTDRAEELRRNVQRLLEARVGLGNAVVEVSVDMLTDREHILERKIDPNGRVAISTETTETSSDSSNGANGAVTVASNLPDG
ncbi:MAG: flagellar M-ring protein FliF, partial [Rhodobacterales bacterium]